MCPPPGLRTSVRREVVIPKPNVTVRIKKKKKESRDVGASRGSPHSQ